jgi:hypothetical protein
VEQMGCRLNAYTSREQTVYYANVLKKDVGASLGILSEMLLHRYLLYVCMCIYVYMYVYIYIYTLLLRYLLYVCMCKYTYIYIYAPS